MAVTDEAISKIKYMLIRGELKAGTASHRKRS